MAEERPNFLLITTDHHRADCLGCYGNRILKTPHLDRLADEGVRFLRSYTNCPADSPAKASLLTGRYPRSHGVWDNGIPLPATERTLAHILSDAGYRTAAVGKLHLRPFGAPADKTSYESLAAWAESDDFVDWHGPYYGFEHVDLALGKVGGHYQAALETNHPEAVELLMRRAARRRPSGAFECWKSALPAKLHADTWIAEMTSQVLETMLDGEQPFFLWVSFPDPSHPFNPPTPYCDMYHPAAIRPPHMRRRELDDKPPHFRAYYTGTGGDFGDGGPQAAGINVTDSHVREIMSNIYGMTSMVDDSIGRLLESLRAAKVLDNTVVTFTSNFGELMGDHGLLLSGPFHYEGLVRIPLIWRYPRLFPQGLVTKALTSHVDYVPTVLELAGLDPLDSLQGKSLTSVLHGRTHGINDYVLVENRPALQPKLNLKTLITQRWKLTQYCGQGYGELYDLKVDAPEYSNVYNKPHYRAIQFRLTRRIVEALGTTEDVLPQPIAKE